MTDALGIIGIGLTAFDQRSPQQRATDELSRAGRLEPLIVLGQPQR